MRLDLDTPQPRVDTYALGDSSALVLRCQPDGSYAVGDRKPKPKPKPKPQPKP